MLDDFFENDSENDSEISEISDYKPLTANRLYHHTFIDDEFKEARIKLLNLAKMYHIITPFENLKHKGINNFVKYFSKKAAKYFECFYNSISTCNWYGEYSSIWSWKYSKEENGKPIYIYIVAIQEYGSCEGCDIVMNHNSQLDYLKFKITYKGDKENKIKEAREFIAKIVISDLSSLKLFKSYNEAKEFIEKRTNYNVKLPSLKSILDGKNKPKQKNNSKERNKYHFKDEDFPTLK
jgi:hypothetical protein